MNQVKIIAGIVSVVVVLLLFFLISSAFMISEVEQAIITKFGRPIHVIAGESNFLDKDLLIQSIERYNQQNNTNVKLSFGAGLYFKTPFITKVEYFDDRILEYDSEAASITTGDKKRIVVDNFARWKIIDPLQFRIRLQNQVKALSQLDDIIYSELRQQLGGHDFIEIIRSTNKILEDEESVIPDQKLTPIEIGRTKIMEIVTKNTRETALEYGIYVIDVRIKRADLPEGNLQAVYQNMIAEREKIAQKYREEGKMRADIIRSQTDREVRTMIAAAERKAQAIRGEAEAESTRIYASGFVKEVTGGERLQIKGYQSNPGFFKFYRSLETLGSSMDGQTQLILDTDNDLLKYINQQDFED